MVPECLNSTKQNILKYHIYHPVNNRWACTQDNVNIFR